MNKDVSVYKPRFLLFWFPWISTKTKRDESVERVKISHNRAHHMFLRIFCHFESTNYTHYCTSTIIHFRGKIRRLVVIELVKLSNSRAVSERFSFAVCSEFFVFLKEFCFDWIPFIASLWLATAGWPEIVGKLQKVVYHPSKRQRTHDTYIPNYLQPKF